MYSVFYCVVTLFQKNNYAYDLFLIGDTLSVVAKICNSSSKKMTPKFSLQQVTVFRAHASRKYSHQSLCKMVGETIAPNSEESVSCQVQIPADIVYTIQNCDIISVEHNLKVCNNNVIVILQVIVAQITLKFHASAIIRNIKQHNRTNYSIKCCCISVW